MNLREIVCHNLKIMRLKSGLSQAQLASRIGKSVRYISALENQAQNVTLATLEALSLGLGVTVVDLVTIGAEAGSTQLKQAKTDFEKAIGLLNRYRTTVERHINPPKRTR